MKTKPLIFFVLVSSSLCSFAEWIIDATKDPITDKHTVTMVSMGTLENKKVGMRAPSMAVICLQATNAGGVPKGLLRVALNAPSVDIDITRGTARLIFRIDSDPAEEFETELVGEDFITFPKPRDLVERMKNASKMVVRYRRMFLGTVTATIDLSDFLESYKQFQKKVLAVGTVAKADTLKDKTESAPAPKSQKEHKHSGALDAAEEYQNKIIDMAKKYALPKLKDKTTFQYLETEERVAGGENLYIVRFMGDGRKLRVGILENMFGVLSIVPKDQIKSVYESSTPR